MDQADQGGQVDLDPGVQVDQVDQVDQVNLVNLDPGSRWTQVAKWTPTPGSKLTMLTKLTWST